VGVDLPLTLAEELLLLAGDTSDRPLPWKLHYGVAGALLTELELAGRIGYSGRWPGRWVIVTDAGPCGDDELDAVLAEIASDEKPQLMEHWVEAFVSVQRTVRLAGRLAARDDLGAQRAELLSRVTRAVQGFSAGDDRAHALAAIVRASGIADTVLADLDLRGLRRRMAQLLKDQRTPDSVRDAIWSARLRAWLPGFLDLRP
jgi:hypothetical protein